MHWIDPDSLPEVTGVVKQFIANPHGDLDGLVLEREAGELLLVHFPPHLTEHVTAAIKPEDTIRVRGVRPRAAAMIAAVSLTGADGITVLDNGPPDQHESKKDHGKHKDRAGADVSGRVRLALHAPKGELRGALLDDGTVLRIGLKEAPPFRALLQPGTTVAARGDGLKTAYGLVVEVREIGPRPGALFPVKTKNPEKDKEKKSRFEGDGKVGKGKVHDDADAMPAANP